MDREPTIMDECDRASAVSADYLADALEARRRPALSGPSATHCDNCDEEIPEKRRELIPGVRLCVTCQEIEEASR